jgi:hypothetical protein
MLTPATTRLTSLRRTYKLTKHINTTQNRGIKTHQLNTGASIPAIGFGTWQDKDAQEGAVLTALKTGYRHIDGAAVYV